MATIEYTVRPAGSSDFQILANGKVVGECWSGEADAKRWAASPALLEALEECAAVGNLASVGRGPVTLVGAEKRLAHIGKTAQDAIDAAA